MDKSQILADFVKTVQTAPQQRTAEWYQIRQTTIGGSEIATLLGCCYGKTIKDLIKSKIGLDDFRGNTATRWGTMFEPMTKKYCEKLLSCEILEIGGVDGVIHRQRYSPDGIGIVQLNNSLNEKKYYIILFEFKAPISSLPNDSIPKHYIPQVQTGLLSLPICDASLFVNNSYRRCSLKDFDFTSKYNNLAHKSDFKKRKKGLKDCLPYAAGMIFFYQGMEEYSYIKSIADGQMDVNQESIDCKSTITLERSFDVRDYDIQYNTIDELLDIGEVDDQLFERIMELYDEKRLNVIYSDIIMNAEVINNDNFSLTHGIHIENNINDLSLQANKWITKFKKSCHSSGLLPVGYLPWKLLVSKVIPETRDAGWKEKIEPRVNEFIKIIDDVLSSDSRERRFNELFIQSEMENIEGIEMINSFTDDICID